MKITHTTVKGIVKEISNVKQIDFANYEEHEFITASKFFSVLVEENGGFVRHRIDVEDFMQVVILEE